MMQILITGAGGKLARRVEACLTAAGHHTIGIPRADLDITHWNTVREAICAHRPDLVINAAALTNVDHCALYPADAYRVNAVGAQNLALACAEIGAALCQISTNEVFDGAKGSPYYEYDATHPANPYGESKWAAERMIGAALREHYIVRTAWLFAHNGMNFLQKILAAAGAGRPIRVVTDEVANPTYTDDLAAAVAALIETRRYGVYHLVNEGYASRYEFARHILDRFGRAEYPITPITLGDFERPSAPPPFTPLHNVIAASMGIRLRSWQEALSAFVEREGAVG
ncbi:MAG TPA: dTDP-4-dehydrorhamnose reductase [Aggregatilineales bacterium]|nr:dTDP-4-dehydrorhamnose reductase [Aggregatilineales bacterium]